jgi:hypothetical protein
MTKLAERIASRCTTEKQYLELIKEPKHLLLFVKNLEQVRLDGEGIEDSDIPGLDILGPVMSHLFLNRSYPYVRRVSSVAL